MSIEKQVDLKEQELLKLYNTDGYKKKNGCTIIFKDMKLELHGGKTAIAVDLSQILTFSPEIAKALEELPHNPIMIMPIKPTQHEQ